jgi:hypothetical protein
VYVIDHFVTRAHKLADIFDGTDQRHALSHRCSGTRPRWLH